MSRNGKWFLTSSWQINTGERWFDVVMIEHKTVFRYSVVVVEPKTPWRFNVDELARRNKHGVDR